MSTECEWQLLKVVEICGDSNKIVGGGVLQIRGYWDKHLWKVEVDSCIYLVSSQRISHYEGPEALQKEGFERQS